MLFLNHIRTYNVCSDKGMRSETPLIKEEKCTEMEGFKKEKGILNSRQTQRSGVLKWADYNPGGTIPKRGNTRTSDGA